MTGLQKTIKCLAICFAIFLIVNILGTLILGATLVLGVEDAITGNKEKATITTETEVIDDYETINELDLETTFSNLIIKSGEEFKIEASEDYSVITNENGKLEIKDKSKRYFLSDASNTITVYVPTNLELKEIDIEAGAGSVEIMGISASSFKLDAGAGKVTISNVNFSNTMIDEGVGEIKITDAVLSNLDLDAGIGSLTIEGKILGSSKIDCGLGSVNINLLNLDTDYKIAVEKGAGHVYIDNEEVNGDYTYGSGTNYIDILGGIGDITITNKAN